MDLVARDSGKHSGPYAEEYNTRQLFEVEITTTALAY